MYAEAVYSQSIEKVILRDSGADPKDGRSRAAASHWKLHRSAVYRDQQHDRESNRRRGDMVACSIKHMEVALS